jgi:hypothetical protein
MDGSTRTGHGTVGTLAADHEVVAIGDYNGDGKSDILIQTVGSGHLTEWLMDGTTRLTGGGILGGNPGSSWHVVTG